MDSDILSAESYYDGVFGGRASIEGQGNDSQWFGGLLANRPISQSPIKKDGLDGMGTRQPSRKDSTKTTGADDSSGVRQRGRPRLDTRDHTAADRRRTQIRLAQRAYRQRKETIIAGLNKRVAALEQTIEVMNKAFLDFNDKAIASGIGEWEPDLAEELKLTMERFLEYARNMAQESEMEDETAPNISARVFEHDDISLKRNSQSSSNSANPTNSQDQFYSNLGAVMVASLGIGISPPPDEDIDVRKAQSSEMENTHTMQISNLDVSDWVEPTQQRRIQPPESIEQQSAFLPSFTSSLPLPASYSFQEKSFARRLLRMSLETAYRLMIDPTSRQEDIFRVCKNTFTWSNKQLFIANIESRLSRSAEESLEDWKAPQWHLGNAGIHYPRTGFDFGSSPPLGWDAKALTGPYPSVKVDNPMDDSLSMDDIVKLLGFDGEWFDPNDVEQYLRGKGLFLDGHSTFVEVDDNFLAEPYLEANSSVFGSPSSSSQDSMGGPRSPQNIEGTYFDNTALQVDEYSWNNEIFSMPDYPDIGIGSLTQSLNPTNDKLPEQLHLFGPQLYPNLPPTFDTSSKRYIDVEKFVKTIVNSGVCLGRAPGFRKSSVDSALASAIRQSF